MRTTSRVPSWVALAAITVAGAGLRLYRADHSLRLDELATAWVIGGGTSGIPERSKLNNLSPAYYTLVSAATGVLGGDELGLRFWSLAAGVAVLPLGALTAVRLTGSPVCGLVAAGLLAVDPVSLDFSQDARPYALVEFFALAAVLAFTGVLARPTWPRRAGLVSAGVVLFYLHYTTALFLLALLVYYLIVWFGDRGALPYRPGQAAADGALVAVACLPALAHLRYLATNRSVLGQFIARPQIEALATLFPLTTFLLLPALAAVVAEFAVSPRVGPAGQPARPGTDRTVALLACWFSVPVLTAWVLTRADLARIYNVRYVFSAWPAALIFTALVFDRFRTRPGRWVMLATCLGLVVSTEGPGRRFVAGGLFTGHGTEQWREAVASLNLRAASDTLPVLVHSGLVEADWVVTAKDDLVTSYCLAPVNSVYRISGARGFHVLPYSRLDAVADDVTRDVLSRGGAWVLWRGPGEAAFLQALGRAFRVSGREAAVTDIEEFSAIRAFRLRVKESAGRGLTPVDPDLWRGVTTPPGTRTARPPLCGSRHSF